jgi:hypothetical protein
MTISAERRAEVTDALWPFLVARACVAAGYAAAQSAASNSGVDAMWTHLREGLVTWDGTFYRTIAAHGYSMGPTGLAEDNPLRFFPLYPLLARALSLFTLGNAAVALVILTNVAALGCLIALRRLVAATFDDDDLARRSMWWLALFPAGAVMVMAYAESLMLLATLGAFLAIRQRRWPLAGGLVFAAALTRPVGILLAVPMAIEVWEGRRELRSWRDRTVAAGVVAAAPLGTSLYLWSVSRRFGDFWLPVDIQSELRGDVRFPVTRLWDAVVLTLGDSQKDAPNLAFAVVLLVAIVAMARVVPRSWTAYTAVTVLVALSSTNIDSIGRYGLVAFPVAVAAAHLTAGERRSVAALAVSAGGLVAITTMSLVGTYIP